MKRLASSLRVRLLVPVLVAILPTAAMLFASAQAERGLLVGRTYDEAAALARTFAAQQQGALEAARGLLLGVVRLPSTRAGDGPACSADVAPLLEATPYVTNVGAMTPDGRVFCSANPAGVGVDLSDRAYVAAALASSGAVASEWLVSRTVEGPAIAVGLAARGPDGRPVAVAFLSLDARRMAAELEAVRLPPGADVTLVDRAGTVVASVPGGMTATGSAYTAPRALELGATGPSAFELELPDRGRRIYAVDEVKLPSGAVAMRVVVSRSVEAAFEHADRIRRRTVLAFAVAAVLALAAAALAAEWLVARRLDDLGRAARRIAGGDLSTRSGLVPTGDELGALVSAFDDMAAALERLTERNRLLLDAIGEGIVGIDRDGRATFVNPAALRMLGRTADELRGANAHLMLHPRRPDGSPFPAEECPIVAVFRSDAAPHAGSDVFYRADGTPFPVELVTTPVRDGGSVVGAVIAFKDVTERTRLEDQLRQAQKMEAVGQLAGGVAHDFNNILTAILSFAELVDGQLPSDHPARADVGEIRHSAQRAAALTRQLLAFSRRQRLAPQVHDLAATVRGMVGMLRRVLGEAVALDVDVRAPATVRADPGQMEIVLLNLAVNARDAMPDGGRLTITVREVHARDLGEDGLPDGTLSVVEVRDTGSGMDEATRARVFEPFFTTKPAGKGTGLGLATVYGIVTQSGGAVRVRSAPGRGTAFVVAFPREGAAVEEVVPPASPPAAGGDETVLLVEDDEVLRGLARRTLTGAGYTVLDAGRPELAAAIAAHAARIDLLLTDVVLPGENGWELSRRIARDRNGLKMLFVSGYTGAAPGRPVLPPEVPFLAKPFTPDALLAKVREVLDAA